MVLSIQGVADLGAAAVESRGNRNSGQRVVAELRVVLVAIPEACLVNDLGVDHGLFGSMEIVVHALRVVPARGEIEIADTGANTVIDGVVVARAESIVGGKVIINARADMGAVLRRGNELAEGLDQETSWIHDLRADDAVVVDVAALHF